MITRLFFRFRAWLILFIFLTLNLSVPHSPAPEGSAANQTLISATAISDAEPDGEELSLEFTCILQMLIEESFNLYGWFSDEDWSTEETTVPAVATFDIISQETYKQYLYPPMVKRLLARNMSLPDDNYPDIPTMPPERPSEIA